jgi:hypothetical protein
MRPATKLSSPLIALIALTLSPPREQALGCATVGPKGSRVAIASETVLIVWDEKTKTQHFIRRASFTTSVPYFGFLVPTPTQPRLAEAPDEVFMTLRRWTEPKVRTAYVFEEPPVSKSLGSPGRVDVLEQKRVSGFNATVLRASDPEALRAWLDRHDYDARPQVVDWVAPYIKAGWIITAFQIAKKEKEEEWLETRAVRMSFRTERPFFPYREPADQRERTSGPRRLLRLYVIAPERRTGQLEDANLDWSGKTAWAAQLRPQQAEEITRLIGAEEVQVQDGAWLTELEDWGSRMAGTSDLIFVPDEEQWTVRRPDVLDIVPIPPSLFKIGGTLVTAGLGFVLLVLIIRRLKRRPVSKP